MKGVKLTCKTSVNSALSILEVFLIFQLANLIARPSYSDNILFIELFANPLFFCYNFSGSHLKRHIIQGLSIANARVSISMQNP